MPQFVSVREEVRRKSRDLAYHSVIQKLPDGLDSRSEEGVRCIAHPQTELVPERYILYGDERLETVADG